MFMNQALLAKYDYLDELDCQGWAWEILRRNDEYRADYNHLQALERPKPFDRKHESLSKKWHVRRLLDFTSQEVPEFFHEHWQDIPADLMLRRPTEWQALIKATEPPAFNSQTWKRSIICQDLKDRGCSINEIARRLYPDYEGQSHETRHRPARHLVQGDRNRLKHLQAEYLKIAFSNK